MDDQHLEPVPGLRVPLREVTVRATRSSGPGGQHANVTDSRVEAVFDVRASAALSDGQRERLLESLGPVVRAVAQEERSQARNRARALERLERRLGDALRPAPPRVPTRTPPRAKRQRLEDKQRRSAAKQARRPPERPDH
jgi:ribosome-associated protein